MTAVIWTDVVQMALYIGGTLVGSFPLLHLVPGGWATIHETASAAGKFQIFDFVPSLTNTFNFWAGVIGGTFLTNARHGTDQLMAPPLLSARNQSGTRIALVSRRGGVVL